MRTTQLGAHFPGNMWGGSRILVGGAGWGSIEPGFNPGVVNSNYTCIADTRISMKNVVSGTFRLLRGQTLWLKHGDPGAPPQLGLSRSFQRENGLQTGHFGVKRVQPLVAYATLVWNLGPMTQVLDPRPLVRFSFSCSLKSRRSPGDFTVLEVRKVGLRYE